MVAVASGPAPRVERWASALGRAGIAAAVTRPLSDDGRDHAELWVRRQDAAEARAAIEDSGFSEECPLW
jgi:hypothetical protein